MIPGKRNDQLEIQLVLAVDAANVIGSAGTLPWHEPADLRVFRMLTAYQPCIMGRRTWEDIVARVRPGKPVLPTRIPIVLTRDPAWEAPPWRSAFRANDLLEAVDLADLHGTGQVCVIGGVQVYDHYAPMADTIYLTRIPGRHEGDAFWDPAWLFGMRLAAEEKLEDTALILQTYHRR